LFVVFLFYSIKEYKNTSDLKNSIDTSIQQQVKEALTDGKKQIENNVIETSKLLKDIGATIKEKGATTNNLQNLFIIPKNEKLKISSIGCIVLNKNNQVLYNGIQKKNADKLEYLQIQDIQKKIIWFEKALNIRDLIIENYYDPILKSYSFAVISKIEDIKFNAEKDAKFIIFGVISNIDIKSLLEDLDFGKRGYPFITTAEGNIILHPLEKNLFLNFKDIVKDRYMDENYNKLLKCFNEKTETYIDERDFSNFSNRKIIALSYSTTLNSFIGAILNKSEIAFPFDVLKNQYLKNTFVVCFTIFFICIFFVGLKKNNLENSVLIKIICTLTAIIFLSGIGFIWYIERVYGMDNPSQTRGYISDRSALKKYLQNEEREVKENKVSEKKYIPTGVLVQSIKILDIKEAQVSGIIWQKIPAEQKGKIKEGIQFPDAITVKLEETYRTKDANGNEVIGWSFMAVLRQQFENKLYPFERLNLKILMSQKNFLEKVQLIPDFDSYEEYSSVAKSFLSRDVTVSEWIVKQTYFSIAQKDFMTTFGYAKNELKNNSGDLLLNITLQRDFLSNFFSNFLPLFVLLLLSHIGLLFSSNDENKSKIFSFKASNMHGIISGFLLFLVFSIASLRKQAFSKELLYIEYLYFFMILVLLFLILCVVHIYGNKKTIFGYKDGFYVKNLYWPVITASIFLITYFNFKG